METANHTAHHLTEHNFRMSIYCTVYNIWHLYHAEYVILGTKLKHFKTTINEINRSLDIFQLSNFSHFSLRPTSISVLWCYTRKQLTIRKKYWKMKFGGTKAIFFMKYSCGFCRVWKTHLIVHGLRLKNHTLLSLISYWLSPVLKQDKMLKIFMSW